MAPTANHEVDYVEIAGAFGSYDVRQRTRAYKAYYVASHATFERIARERGFGRELGDERELDITQHAFEKLWGVLRERPINFPAAVDQMSARAVLRGYVLQIQRRTSIDSELKSIARGEVVKVGDQAKILRKVAERIDDITLQQLALTCASMAMAGEQWSDSEALAHRTGLDGNFLATALDAIEEQFLALGGKLRTDGGRMVIVGTDLNPDGSFDEWATEEALWGGPPGRSADSEFSVIESLAREVKEVLMQCVVRSAFGNPGSTRATVFKAIMVNEFAPADDDGGHGIVQGRLPSALRGTDKKSLVVENAMAMVGRSKGSTKFCRDPHSDDLASCTVCAKCTETLSKNWARAKNDFQDWARAPTLCLVVPESTRPEVITAAREAAARFLEVVASELLSAEELATLPFGPGDQQ